MSAKGLTGTALAKLPERGTSGHNILLELLRHPGTFYQICERMKIDIEDERVERNQLSLFDTLLGADHIFLTGVVYSVSASARATLNPPAHFAGQVAGPAYRGKHDPRTVFITRRPEGART